MASNLKEGREMDDSMIDKNTKDSTLGERSTTPTVKQLAGMFECIGTDGPGQTAVNKKAKPAIKEKPLITGTVKPPIKDTPLITGRNMNGDVESGPNKLRTTGTSSNLVSDDTPTENKGQEIPRDDTHLNSEYDVEHGCDFIETNEDVFRPEATFIDDMNYVDIGQMLQNLNINVSKSIEEDKHKLKQRLFSGQQIHSFNYKIKDVLNKTVQKYNNLKKKLQERCSDLIATVQNESYKTNMSEVTEMKFPRYEEELRSIRTMLQNMTDEFEIVVSGETSSGKSTFLNVLLGESILPSHHLHTTASLCRLRNSEDRRIECIVENRTVDRIPLKADSSELREKLESITDKLLSKDGDDEPLQAIDIYWLVSSLHKVEHYIAKLASRAVTVRPFFHRRVHRNELGNRLSKMTNQQEENVVLVDTPGIGERDALTKQVVECIPKSAGYIFIVDSSHAGGVQDSGIRKLIEAIAVSPSKEDRINDLSNTIFVCNKWDLVPKQDREAVVEDTKKKISKYCGQLEDWRIVQFNGNLELKLLELKANPTDNFKMLLRSLETLMIRTIETRLRDKYRWLHTFVSGLTGFVTARISTAELSKEKAQVEMEKARRELDLATKELEQCSEVEAMIATEEKSLLQELQEYLQSADVQEKHFDWTNCAPELSKVEKDGPALIKERLQDVIFEWATAETGPLQQASVRITDKCKEMQTKIDSRISNLNRLELGFSLLKSSDERVSLSSDENDSLSSKGIAIVVAASPIWITVGLVVLVIGLIPGLVWVVNRAVHSKARSIKKMTKITKKAIDTLVSENHLKNFITDSFTGLHSTWLTKFKDDTVRIITSTRASLYYMETQLHLNMDKLQMFKSLQTKLNECSNLLYELKHDI